MDMIELLLSADTQCSEHEIDCASHLLQIYGYNFYNIFLATENYIIIIVFLHFR